MKTALLHEDNDLRTFVLVLGCGDETMSALASFAAENRLKASQFSAIGAFERAVVAYFEWDSRQYRNIPIDEQVEVLSMTGDTTLEDRSPKVHAHVVACRSRSWSPSCLDICIDITIRSQVSRSSTRS